MSTNGFLTVFEYLGRNLLPLGHLRSGNNAVELLSKRGTTLSELLRPFRSRYFLTGELNTRVDDVDAKLGALEERFGAQGAVSHLDGVSVEAEDWHFNVRPSNTEPLLRLNLEAIGSEELMERKRDEVLGVIRGES